MRKKEAGISRKKVMARTASQSLMPKPKKVENVFLVRPVNITNLKKIELPKPESRGPKPTANRVTVTSLKVPNYQKPLNKQTTLSIKPEPVLIRPKEIKEVPFRLGNKSSGIFQSLGKPQATYFVALSHQVRYRPRK